MNKVYTAGKIWHADKFRFLRDTLGVTVNARWIDYGDDHPIVQQKDELWRVCYEDVAACDYLLLYSEQWEEEQRGALVEVGMAYGLGKPVFAINRCRSTSPNQISDVAFTHFHAWTWLESVDLVNGWLEAETKFHNDEVRQALLA